MIARPRASPAARRLAAAALLALAACRHENPPTPRPPPREAIDVSAVALSTAEGGAPAAFDVVLRSRPAAPVEVEVRSGDTGEGLVLAPGYAVPGPAQGVTFTPDDWDLPRQVAVDPVDDPDVDGPVRYEVTLRVAYSEDGAYAALPPAAVAVTNADDDVPGILVSSDRIETAEGGAPVRLRIRLATRPSAGVQVGVSSGDESEGLVAAVGWWMPCSYPYPGATLTFDPRTWNVPQELDVCPQDDRHAEPPHTYGLRVFASGWAPEYEHVPEVIVTVTNASDDVASLAIWTDGGEPLVTAESGAEASFTVALATPPLADVVVPVTSGNAAAGLVAAGGGTPAPSSALTFTPLTWEVPQEVRVVGQDDAGVEGSDVEYEIRVGPPEGADPIYPTLAARTIAARNLDDDVVALRIDPGGPFTTSETGTSRTFTISVGPPRGGLTVRVTSGNAAEGLLAVPGDPPLAGESVDVQFASTDWSPRTVFVVGQRDEAVDGDQTFVTTVAVVAGDARYLALPPQALTVTNEDDLAASVRLATYDATVGVPRCAAVAHGCGSGALLEGRDGVTYVYTGAWMGEAHAPNTLFDAYGARSCLDGSSGYSRRALEELKVYTVDGAPLAGGAEVRIEARVVGEWWQYDWLDLHFAPDAAAPAWQHLATLGLAPPFPDPLVLGTTVPLPGGGPAVAIRGTWRYGTATPVSTCTWSSYDDVDDLVFAADP